MSILDVDNYVMAALSFHAVFMAIYLFTAAEKHSEHLKLLGGTFVMLAAWYFSSFLENTGILAKYPSLISWPTLFIPLFAPCLYFYVQTISTRTNWSYRAQSKVHFYVAAVIILIELPFALSPGDIKIMQLDHVSSEPEGWAKILIQLGWTSTALLLIQFATYIVLSIRRLLYHAVRIRHLFSNLDNRTLVWLRNYLFLLCLLWGLGLSDFVDLPNQYSWAAHLLWVMTFSLLGLRQKPVFEGFEKKPASSEQPLEAIPNKPSRTILSVERRKRIAAKLRQAMEKNYLYRDADLTLRKLSDATGVSTHHISETLREEMGQNFYDYVNKCRVEEACKLLKATENTTIDIAFAVGFNSRSTFNSAFKKHTATSPAAYRKTTTQ